MTNVEVANDLAQRLLRLHMSVAAMTGEYSPLPRPIGEQALWWAEALEGAATMGTLGSLGLGGFADPGDAADVLLTHLITEREQNGSAFWGTDLGRAIAAAGRAPVRPGPEHLGDDGARVPGATLAAILGVSRNRAFELQKAGRLLTAAQVADELRAREAS